MATAMTSNRPIAVAVVEDLRLTRDHLRLLLEGSEGFRCFGTFSSVEEALAHPGAAPDVLLLDIALPGMQGSVGVRPLLEKWPQTVALMHTVFDEDDKVFEALCNGAKGFILKRTPPARLLESVREAHEGGSPLSPEIARKVVGLFQRVAPPRDLPQTLAPQELRLLRLFADGYGYESAGAVLGISSNTVRTYVRRIYEKLHVHSRSAAVSKALRAGLL